jgi:hypothetical protein
MSDLCKSPARGWLAEALPNCYCFDGNNAPDQRRRPNVSVALSRPSGDPVIHDPSPAAAARRRVVSGAYRESDLRDRLTAVAVTLGGDLWRNLVAARAVSAAVLCNVDTFALD